MMKVDAMGKDCPIPVIMTKKAIAELGAESQVEVFVDNAIAVQNVTKLAISQGGEVENVQLGEAEYKVVITMKEKESVGADEKVDASEAVEEAVQYAPVEDNTVMAFASDLMGSGNDDLGKVLMKGFIFAVSQLEELPKTMLFYNGGATLTSEGSDSIADLQHLQEEGVEILTCGTCLNYYNMSDKLLVGEVTNMYTIVEKLAGATKIIRP